MATRRDFLTSAVAATVAPRLVRGQERRPNFVVVLTDDQRFDTIGALGNRAVHTPNMDRLVARGLTFTHACTQGGLTAAICMPSRAQLLTARSVFRVHHGIVDRQDRPDPAMVTFPEVLRKAGYITFATGKWHNGPALLNRGFSHGSNIFFGGMTDQLKVPVHEYDPSGRYPKQNAYVSGKFSSDLFTDAATRFLRERDTSKPFLLCVAFTSPHDPRMAPLRYQDLFPADKIKLPENFLPQHPFDNGELKVRDELLAGSPRTEAEIRRHLAGYYAMIAEVDHNIGRILDAVNERPDSNDTYIVFAGDNGLAVGQHGLMGKQNLYEHSLRVPLIVAGPGAPANRRADTICNLMDVGATIAELGGTFLPGDLEGMSLRRVIADPHVRVRNCTVAAYRNVQRAIRTDRYKLILYNFEGRRTVQLFDVEQDPWEMRNLASTQKKRVAELTQLLHTELVAAGDPDAAAWI